MIINFHIFQLPFKWTEKNHHQIISFISWLYMYQFDVDSDVTLSTVSIDLDLRSISACNATLLLNFMLQICITIGITLSANRSKQSRLLSDLSWVFYSSLNFKGITIHEEKKSSFPIRNTLDSCIDYFYCQFIDAFFF